MDFYSHQEDARRRSRSLLWRFVVANLLVVAAASIFLLVVVNASSDLLQDKLLENFTAESIRERLFRKNQLLIIIPFNIFLVSTISISALRYFRKLSSSGGAVAQMVGGMKIPTETSDPLERRFLNIIDEMAIAANMPAPEAYVLERQPGINAFACGPSPEHSAIAVTRGALERLSRDDLQGVVAHEFSHIMHADVRLNIRLAAYIYGLLVVSNIGHYLQELARGRHRHSSWHAAQSDKHEDSNMYLLAIGLFLIAVGSIGKTISAILAAALSREREYLADSTAVELTRNPTGIANALKKIGGFDQGSQVSIGAEKGLSHFFLAEPITRGFLNRMLSTHPPLTERISRLDPTFTGEYPANDDITLQTGIEGKGAILLSSGHFIEAGEQLQGREVTQRQFEVPFLHRDWLPPFDLHSAIVDFGLAEGTLCTLLLSSDPTVRAKQEELLPIWMPLDDVAKREALLRNLSINQKLSAVLMAIPTIQAGSDARKSAFRGTLQQLAEMDQQESFLEFLTLVLLSYALLETDPSFSIRGTSAAATLLTCREDISVILGICAHFATTDEQSRQALLDKATKHLQFPCHHPPASQIRAEVFLRSLLRLRSLTPAARGTLCKLFESTLKADGAVSEYDIAIMRLISILLRLPLSVEFESGTPNIGTTT